MPSPADAAIESLTHEALVDLLEFLYVMAIPCKCDEEDMHNWAIEIVKKHGIQLPERVMSEGAETSGEEKRTNRTYVLDKHGADNPNPQADIELDVLKKGKGR